MNTKNILIIILVIVFIVMTVLVAFAVVTNMTNAGTYQRVNLSSTCSLELPKIHFDESNDGGSSSYAGVTVDMKSKVLSSNDLVISYLKTTDNTGFSSDSVYKGNSQFNVAHQDWYTRDISNSATGETISIMGKDKKQVDHIADSIQFSGGSNKTDNNTNVVYVNKGGNTPNTTGTQNAQPNNNPTPAPTPTPSPTPEPTPTPGPVNRTAKVMRV